MHQPTLYPESAEKPDESIICEPIVAGTIKIVNSLSTHGGPDKYAQSLRIQ